MVVTNGHPDGTKRVSSASISLDGALIVGPKDFNQRVSSIVRPVELAATNDIEVRIASRPGAFLAVEVQCAASPALLTLGAPGVSLLGPTTLSSAVPLANTGATPPEDVELNEIALPGGTLTVPASLPFDLGTIPAAGAVPLNSTFSGTSAPLGSYPLAPKGTYSPGGATYYFDLTGSLRIPPGSAGSAPLGSVTIPSNQVTGAPFPPRPPLMGGEVNTQQWTVPTAPFEAGGPPPGSTSVLAAPISDAAAVGPIVTNTARPIVFPANDDLGITTSLSPTAEPSGASGGGVIFVTAHRLRLRAPGPLQGHDLELGEPPMTSHLAPPSPTSRSTTTVRRIPPAWRGSRPRVPSPHLTADARRTRCVAVAWSSA